jgi:hypothetical protein
MDCSTELFAALDKIDAALAKKPKADGHIFSEAARHLCAVREAWLRAADPNTRQQLAHLNGVISMVLAGHFPLGEVPWNELELARSWLAALCPRRTVA